MIGFFFVHGNERPESVRGGKYFDKLSNCRGFLKRCNYRKLWTMCAVINFVQSRYIMVLLIEPEVRCCRAGVRKFSKKKKNTP